MGSESERDLASECLAMLRDGRGPSYQHGRALVKYVDHLRALLSHQPSPGVAGTAGGDVGVLVEALERIERGDVITTMEWSAESERIEIAGLRAIARKALAAHRAQPPALTGGDALARHVCAAIHVAAGGADDGKINVALAFKVIHDALTQPPGTAPGGGEPSGGGPTCGDCGGTGMTGASPGVDAYPCDCAPTTAPAAGGGPTLCKRCGDLQDELDGAESRADAMARALQRIGSREPSRPLGGCNCSTVAKEALGISRDAPCPWPAPTPVPASPPTLCGHPSEHVKLVAGSGTEYFCRLCAAPVPASATPREGGDAGTLPSSTPRPPQTAETKKRTCNRHDDCDAADAEVRAEGRKDRYGMTLTRADHCNDDCCEDCFGS